MLFKVIIPFFRDRESHHHRFPPASYTDILFPIVWLFFTTTDSFSPNIPSVWFSRYRTVNIVATFWHQVQLFCEELFKK